jgi:hypothetical protein
LLKITDYDPLEVDLVLDGSNAHLAYARYSNSKLYYMNLIIDNPNANCGPSNRWYCAEIETLGSSPSQIDGVSIAMAEGKPVIAYNDRNDLNRAILKVAQPILGPGNCGPDGDLFPTWECLIVDDGIRPFALNVNLGKPAIAYYAQYKVLRISYNDETNDNLFLVQNRLSTPFVNALTPATIGAGSSDLEVTVTGNNFGDEAWIIIDNTYVSTARISSSELRTTIFTSALGTAGDKQIQVCNPPFPLSDCSNVLTFTVTPKQNQTITFAALPNRTLGDPPFTVSATASSALTVVFASTTPAICTVNGNTVTLVATGSCSVVASQPGNTVYNAAQPITQTFQVQAVGQTNQQSIYLPMITR